MNTDELIKQLARSPAPHRMAASPGVQATLWCAAATAVAIMWAVAAFGVRPDAAVALPTVRWIGCVVGFLALAGAAAYFGFALSRPGRVLGPTVRLMLAAALVSLGIGIGAYAALPSESFSSGFALSGLACSFVVGLLSLVPGAALFWTVRRLAPMAPSRVGAAIGVAAGAVANLGLIVHCPVENAMHIVVYHGLPVLLLAIVGGIAGSRILRW